MTDDDLAVVATTIIASLQNNHLSAVEIIAIGGAVVADALMRVSGERRAEYFVEHIETLANTTGLIQSIEDVAGTA